MLGLSDLLKLRAAETGDRKHRTAGQEPETAIIFIWLPGGPPHMEMYDMKPEAPAEGA